MLKFYNLQSCGYCRMVRDKLDELGLEYERIEVPPYPRDRKEVFDVSGQFYVPVLVDGEVVLDDEEKILDYLENTYAQGKE
ncbi:MAG TPA: glutathione S-transferase N-terminal domain-containing protein [Candidatus Manganitrophaceae bacterium]|nr:glutathione S-transferase N-terminal domain-containing protein [Candidatus Manganitrophaceae bacterium]